MHLRPLLSTQPAHLQKHEHKPAVPAQAQEMGSQYLLSYLSLHHAAHLMTLMLD